MEKLKKNSLPVAILVIGMFLVGFYYIIEINKYKAIEQQKAIQEKKVDTLTINGIVAVYFNPMDEWIEERKKINENDFYTAADDYVWYWGISTKFLEGKGIEIVNTEKRYLDFIKDSGQHVLIDRNSINEKERDNRGWGVFLFDGKQDPLNASMVDMQSEYEKYFK